MKNLHKYKILFALLVTCLFLYSCSQSQAASMSDYCIQPPFVASVVPPLVMFEMARDHKLYYEAYSDSADLDGDGKLDITYKHSIDYYGYFDPYKCYTYNTTGTNKYVPVAHTTTKFCSTSGGQWSGNFLNWLTMSRMDVLKKVLYGGHRSTDSSSETILERAFIPQDAHSWGKEFTGRLCYNASGTPQYTYNCSIDSDCDSGYSCVNKSMELIGFAQAGQATCSAATPGTTNNKMLVVRYKHPSGITSDQELGASHDDLLASFASATEPLTSTFIDYTTSIADFGTSGTIIDPSQQNLDNYSAVVVAEFVVGNSNATWQFMVDSDDGAEVEIFTTAGVSLGVVASYYGGHSSCSTAPTTTCGGMVTGSVSLAKNTWYRLVARYSEKTGQDGIRIWYKNPSKSSWTLFGATNLGSNKMRTYNITSSNQCTLYATEFITTGKPTTGALSQDSSQNHMVCNTNLSTTGAPLMRLKQNVSGKRIWDWASKERPVCDSSTVGTPTDFEVRVKVCDSSINTTDQLDISKNEVGDSCKLYPGSGTGIWKPVGLLQQYGEGDGSKVCSKTMSKSCSTDSGCNLATEGKCIDRAEMYFGLMTTSYLKNTSGGVLRKNIGAILDESNANNGIFQTSENTQGNIIITLDRMKIVGFDFSDQTYDDTSGGNCGWITTRPMNEGECRSWGNPIAEMMYESFRYFSGKLTPTADFTYTESQDSGLALSKPSWGYKDGSNYKSLYDIFPPCAKPFVLLLSDVNTSYDADQIPGSSFLKSGFTGDPDLKLQEVQTSSRTLLNDLAHTIGSVEGVNNTARFIGETSTVKDFLCSGKTETNLGLLRGICPEEPTKMGSYYSAALAYYGKTKFNAITGKPNINTFVVALSSPFSDLQIKTPTGTLSLLPTAKSVSGSHSLYTNCAQRMNLTYSDTYGLQITPKTTPDLSAYCPTNSIVDYYVDDIRYDSSGNVIYALFRINYEDVEQGADHDMDAIVRYEICSATAATNNYGSCGSSSLASNQVEVKLFSDYAAGSMDQVMGFIMSGTTEDGVYLPVKDKDVSAADSDTPAVVADLPLNWSKVFTVGSSDSATSLKNPLWYAAKWGGFDDKNGNNKPDQKDEWAKECSNTDSSKCNPDNYYMVVNPLKLRQQLNKALRDILRRVSSGTAASILNNSEGSGATLLQAIFYPKKVHENQTEISWSGELLNLWYYVDPFFVGSKILEDTDYTSGNHVMHLKKDKKIRFYFDEADDQTKILRYNFDGTTENADLNPSVSGGLKSLWSAGMLLWKRNLSSDPRKIYTSLDGVNLTGFTKANASSLKSLLNAEGTDDAEKIVFAEKVIDYVHGTDVCLNDSSPCTKPSRNRTVEIKTSDSSTESRVWKLGDIISSTPKIQGALPLQTYNLAYPEGYDDRTYKPFYSTDTYTSRGMVYVGANDGMLHAIKLGVLTVKDEGDNRATLAGTQLGREEWAFIPKNILPYLKYLTLRDYDNNHLYSMDGSTTLFDVATNTVAARDDYWNETRAKTSWKTILLGGMGIGGASKNLDSSCTDKVSTGTCVKTPMDNNGFSSYFALDITNQDFYDESKTYTSLRAQPVLKWEFSHPELGYATSGPAVIRLKPKPAVKDDPYNGRWFAIYASGPTGPIDATSKQFKGKSDQNLKLFVVDLEKGPVISADPKQNGLWIIDTGIQEAFAGSITNNAVVDAEIQHYTTNENLRQDDVVYIGYTKKASNGTWTDGGVLRLVIPDTADPDSMEVAKWRTSKVIDGIGPVTTAVSKLMSQKNLYLFFGTGRYFYAQDDFPKACASSADCSSGDTCDSTMNVCSSTMRRLFMVKEKCYPVYNAGGEYLHSDISPECSTTDKPVLTLDDLTNRSTPAAATVPNGWYVSLDSGERVVTDTVATINGSVFYTTFKPTDDICGFGGKSYLWGVKYDTGAALPATSQRGTVLIQLSTGSFAEIDLSTALSDKDGRRTGETSALSFGKSSLDRGLFMTSAGLKPVRKILHIQERFK